MRLIPKNWSEFQQYKDRKPQWIKLHRELLNDFAYSSVQIGTKATLPLLWLLACEYEDGIIDASIEEISFRIHIDENTVRTAIDELTKHKFFNLVQDCTEMYKTVPREEKRREEKEKEKSKEYISEIISYLNEKSGKKFKATSSNCKKHIQARLNENYKIDDFKIVIDKKIKQWSKNQKMSTYIRPETLFGTRFDSYLNEMEAKSNFDLTDKDYSEKDF